MHLFLEQSKGLYIIVCLLYICIGKSIVKEHGIIKLLHLLNSRCMLKVLNKYLQVELKTFALLMTSSNFLYLKSAYVLFGSTNVLNTS